MHNVGVSILEKHPRVGPEKVPLVGEGGRGPPSPLIVELIEAIRAGGVAMT